MCVLANGREVEILNVIDDHSRLCVASVALRVFKAIDVVSTFYKAAGTWGLPAAVLSDNGAIFTAASRHGVCVMESELLALGIDFKHSRPYHPQTCGKVERFHQTMKKYLAAHKARPFDRGPPSSARCLRRVLQHGASAPGDRTPDPRARLRRPQEGPTLGQPPRRPAALPGPPRQGQRGQRDTALREHAPATSGWDGGTTAKRSCCWSRTVTCAS